MDKTVIFIVIVIESVIRTRPPVEKTPKKGK